MFSSSIITPMPPSERTTFISRDEKPPLDPQARALLEEAYRPDVRRVTELVGADPPWVFR